MCGGQSSSSKAVVKNFIRDKNGFIWCATNGLYRYDGIGCKFFSLKAKNQKFKHNVEITCLDTTGDGDFIIGTSNHGLYLFDPNTEKSRPFSSAADSFLFTTTITCLLVDKGSLYIGTNAGLFKSTLECNELTQDETFPTSEVYKIFKVADGSFWVCTSDRGLLSVDFDKNTVTDNKPGVQIPNIKNSISAIAEINDSVFS